MSNYNNKTIVDLLTIKHSQLRKLLKKMYSQDNKYDASQMEGHILSVLEANAMSLSQLAQKIGVSRQAVHKCAQGLVMRGYISIRPSDTSKREKIVSLASRGIQYCKDTLVIKNEIEDQVSKIIGKDEMAFLKQLLEKDWV